jgi:hypothetical protein
MGSELSDDARLHADARRHPRRGTQGWTPSICQAGQFTAEDLLRREGFTDVQYIKKTGTQEIETALASGEANIALHFNVRLIMRVEAGDPIVILAGGHLGCFELFGTDRVRTIRDLKGMTVAVPELDSSRPAFIATMAAHVGLDPRKDIKWVTLPPAESMRRLVEGKVDAFLGFPPQPQQLRAMKAKSIHVVVNSMVDRPWSQYFCGMVVGNREFVKKHPVATRKALRAILTASDRVDREPEKTAQFLVDGHFTEDYDPRGADRNEDGIHRVAGVRSRGHDPVLLAAPAGGRHDQIEPQQDHFRWHGLAVAQRAETQAEGVIATAGSSTLLGLANEVIE